MTLQRWIIIGTVLIAAAASWFASATTVRPAPPPTPKSVEEAAERCNRIEAACKEDCNFTTEDKTKCKTKCEGKRALCSMDRVAPPAGTEPNAPPTGTLTTGTRTYACCSLRRSYIWLDPNQCVGRSGTIVLANKCPVPPSR